MLFAELNGVRFDPQDTRGHVESFFVKATSPAAERALWLKATVFRPTGARSKPVAEAWAIAFDHRNGQRRSLACKHQLPWTATQFAHERLGVAWNRADGQHLSLSDDGSSGLIRTRGRSIAWQLSLRGAARPFVTLPFARLYRGRFPSSKTVTPYPDLRIDGEVIVDDERWEVRSWHGMQGHNWGRGHAEQYAWCHCNQWESSAPLVLEAVSARVRVGPMLLPMLTLAAVRHEGLDYLFNRLDTSFRTKATIDDLRYSFRAETGDAIIDGVASAPAKDFVGLYYANPNGVMTYCLNSKLTQLDLRFTAKGGRTIDLSSQAAALEFGTRRADHGVTMHV